MKRRIRIMQIYLNVPIKEKLAKEGITEEGMDAKEVYLQEDLLPLGINVASIIVKETT
jgi:hypothetical protein